MYHSWNYVSWSFQLRLRGRQARLRQVSSGADLFFELGLIFRGKSHASHILYSCKTIVCSFDLYNMLYLHNPYKMIILKDRNVNVEIE